MPRPSLFIGSSKENLLFARAARALLSDEADVQVWNEGVFKLSQASLESLLKAVEASSHAVLILMPEDLTTSQEHQIPSPRDNVLFELGLFMGRLGRDRTFALVPNATDLKIPSDLAGITLATFRLPARRDDFTAAQAALGPACDLIRQQLVQTPRPDRRSALIGSWHGRGEDTWVEVETPLFSYELTAELSVNGSAVSGHFRLKILERPDYPLIELDTRGQFYDSNIIQTFYESTDPARRQAGVGLLKLSGEGTSIQVRYSAFSAMRDCLATWVFRLEKDNPTSG